MHNETNRGALTVWAMRQHPEGNREIGKDAIARLLVSLAELAKDGTTQASAAALGEYAGGIAVRSVTAGLSALEEQGYTKREGKSGRYVSWGFPKAPAQEPAEHRDQEQADMQDELFIWALKQRPKSAHAQRRHLNGRVLTALAAHATSEGYASISVSALAEEPLGIHRRAVSECLDELRDAGLIAVVDSSEGRAWTFRPVWQREVWGATSEPVAQD